MLVDLGQKPSSQNVKIPSFSKVTDPQLSALLKLILIRSCFLHIAIEKNPSHVSS